jgi:hypothetical protein
MHFTIEELIDLTETWLVKGDLNPDMLGENFQFISPFWKGNNKAEFLSKFLDPTEYKKVSLSNITKFDPLLQFKGLDKNHFSIILQYHTKNGSNVWEAVLGTVENGLLIELRSIYDLEATKKAHDIK